MPATAQRRRPALPQIADLRALVESYSLQGDQGSPLRIDKEAGIIYGVKLGGRFSPNCHGIAGVTEGTEYTPSAYKSALSLYEGLKVYPKHLARPGQKNTAAPTDRGPFDYLGVIRNARYDDAADCPRGDFHYRKSHPDAAQIVEDVERGMGGFGFSHHIPPGGFVAKVLNKRLVVEQITKVKSVDLVDDPATTRNLWEAKEPTMKTLREILESKLATFKAATHKKRLALGKQLLEDDAFPVDTPMPADAPDADSDPDAALWSGFKAAIMAILEGDETADEKAKKIAKYIKAHEKLTADTEPAKDDSAAPAATEEDEDDEDDEDDGEPEAKDKDAKESREVRRLRVENACLKDGLTPSAVIMEALCGLDPKKLPAAIKEMKESARPAAHAGNKPKSGGPGAKPLQESKAGEKKVPTGEPFLASIRERR